MSRVAVIAKRMASTAFDQSKTTGGPVAQKIRQKLNDSFAPTHLEVICESHMHGAAAGVERHFKVVVVSEKFEGLTTVARHRLVNQALADELAGPVHALTISAIPHSAYIANETTTPKSPSCLGGGKK